MMVGQLLGAEPLAGIGACSPVIQLVNAVFLVFSIGSSTNAAIALGQRDREKANRLYTVGIWFGLFVSLVFVAVMELVGPPLCLLLANNDATLIPYVLDYYRPILFVTPCLFLTLGVAQYMKIDGHPKMASYIAVVANVVNLGFDYCFISKDLLNWGVMGASLSMVCGYVVATCMVVPYLRSKEKSFHRVSLAGSFGSTIKEVFSAGSALFPEAGGFSEAVCFKLAGSVFPGQRRPGGAHRLQLSAVLLDMPAMWQMKKCGCCLRLCRVS